MADQVVRTLDEEAVTPSDRLRLIALYILFKDGIVPADLEKLLFHSQLPPGDGDVIRNLELLGARIGKDLKEKRDPASHIFPPKSVPPPNAEEYALSRFTTAVENMLEAHVYGQLPQDIFPYVKPHAEDAMGAQDNGPAASLRSAKPTWAKSRLSSVEPRQRVIVFVAGGATYSEARACYEVSHKTSRDIFLVTSHMMNPSLYLRQLGDLSVSRRNLRLPIDMPQPKAPAHLFEKPEPPKPAAPPAGPKTLPNIPGGLPSRPGGGRAPPTQGLANMTLNSGRAPAPSTSGQGSHLNSGKLTKDKDEKKKKKHHFFSSSKS
jgi:syntaxin-binding protein 1